MPDAKDYAKYPAHPLAGVSQEVLDAGRKQLREIADYEKVIGSYDEELDSIADAVTMAVVVAQRQVLDA